MMKTNIGAADRVARLVIAAIIMMLFFTRSINGTLATVCIALGGYLLATSLVASCPVYSLLGITTCRKK